MNTLDYVSLGILIVGLTCIAATLYILHQNRVYLRSIESYFRNNFTNNHKELQTMILGLATNPKKSEGDNVIIEYGKLLGDIGTKLLESQTSFLTLAEKQTNVFIEAKDGLQKDIELNNKYNEEFQERVNKLFDTIELNVKHNFQNIITDLGKSETERAIQAAEKFTENRELIKTIFEDFSNLETSKVNSINDLRIAIIAFTENVQASNIKSVIHSEFQEHGLNLAKIIQDSLNGKSDAKTSVKRSSSKTKSTY